MQKGCPEQGMQTSVCSHHLQWCVREQRMQSSCQMLSPFPPTEKLRLMRKSCMAELPQTPCLWSKQSIKPLLCLSHTHTHTHTHTHDTHKKKPHTNEWANAYTQMPSRPPSPGKWIRHAGTCGCHHSIVMTWVGQYTEYLQHTDTYNNNLTITC